jgi:hypothetical protein
MRAAFGIDFGKGDFAASVEELQCWPVRPVQNR